MWISKSAAFPSKYLLRFIQVVQNILPPVPLDIPMVLIKPQQACSTAEVYKVVQIWR